MGQGSTRAPPLHTPASASHPPIALRDPILLMSSSAAPWNFSACNWGPHKSRNRVLQDDTPTRAEEKPRKQVRFDVDGSWVVIPMLPLGLTLFLADGTAAEWDDAPSSSTPMPMDSPQPAPSKSPQCHPTYMGGAQPKVLAKPSADWSQLRTLSRPKGRARQSKLPLQVDLSRDFQAWHPPPPTGGRRLEPVGGPFRGHCEGRSWWLPGPTFCAMAGGGLQVASCPAGGLQVVGCPALAWQASSPRFYACHWYLWPQGLLRSWGKRRPWPWPGHYRPVPKNLGPQQVFYVMLHESFRNVWLPDDPQWGWYSWGLLLKPTGQEHGTSPTLEEEATILGREIKPPQVLGSLPEQPEICRFVEPAKQSTTPGVSSPSPMSNLVTSILRRPRNPGKGWKPILTTQAAGSALTYRNMMGCWYGGDNSDLSSAPQMNA